MKTTTKIIGIVAVSLIAFGCARVNSESTELLEVEVPLQDYSFGSLRIYPVLANDVFISHRRSTGPYITLSEAVRENKVVISEHVTEPPGHTEDIEGEDFDVPVVNTLFAENVSTDTVLILSGEIVNGGNQDRMIAMDVTIPPHSGKLDLSVFCVEKGRWSGSEVFFTVGTQSLPPAELRSEARELNDQKIVWDKVDMKMAEMDVESPTGAIADLMTDDDYQKELDAYVSNLKDVFDGRENVVGVIAVVGDKIIGCDIFATHELLDTYFPNMLQSYSSEALSIDEKPSLEAARIQVYLKEVTEKAKSEGFLKSERHSANRKIRPHFSML